MMLGCQDFCGYYDWTFYYIRRRFGQNAVKKLWSSAIAEDSQRHYVNAGRVRGLRGLYDTWCKTGEDEHCDWTFTLDEEKNVLRMDMRRCPSKSFLLQQDLNADEDYCDHCIGWIDPALRKIGAELAAHEHNHCGQCWWEMRMKHRPYDESLDLDIDIRKDPRWGSGYVDSWRDHVKLPVMPRMTASDVCNVLTEWFAEDRHLTVLGRGPSVADEWTRAQATNAVLITNPTYVKKDDYVGEPRAVLIGDRPNSLQELSDRFHATDLAKRPLLMHVYLPGNPMIDFLSAGLPRPVPILPLLIRPGLYSHRPGQPYPTTGVFMLMLAVALDKAVTVAGIDLYKHPSGQIYNNSAAVPHDFNCPAWHSEACDIMHIRRSLAQSKQTIKLHPMLEKMLSRV